MIPFVTRISLPRYLLVNCQITGDCGNAEGKRFGKRQSVAFAAAGADEDGIIGKDFGILLIAHAAVEDDFCAFWNDFLEFSFSFWLNATK